MNATKTTTFQLKVVKQPVTILKGALNYVKFYSL